MSGKTLNRARKDVLKYVTKGGFEEDIVLSTPDNSHSLQLKGLASKHWINYDADGGSINSKNAHICISEETLTNSGYPVRNAQNEVHLMRHKVDVKDSSGVVKNYVIKEWFPSETVGLIVCILGDYESN